MSTGTGAGTGLEPYHLSGEERRTVQSIVNQLAGARIALDTFVRHVERANNLPTQRGNWALSEDETRLMPPAKSGSSR